MNEPVVEFTGEIIAIINRVNDVEDKWVVEPKGLRFTSSEIKKAVHQSL